MAISHLKTLHQRFCRASGYRVLFLSIQAAAVARFIAVRIADASVAPSTCELPVAVIRKLLPVAWPIVFANRHIDGVELAFP
jgi:hypothetical protein